VRTGLAPSDGERWWAGIILKSNKEKTSRSIGGRIFRLAACPSGRLLQGRWGHVKTRRIWIFPEG
jgi:hypothetical protein